MAAGKYPLVLVAGATGQLGHAICQKLIDRNYRVRAFIRGTAAPEKINYLTARGCAIAVGDLKNVSSIQQALAGVDAVISTATSLLSQHPEDTFETVDRDGHFHLFNCAKAYGISKIVYVSFVPMLGNFPLQAAKRAVEDKLAASGLDFTTLQPAFFMETWLSARMGFNLEQAQVRIFGSGQNPVHWISHQDVATAAVVALENSSVAKRIVALPGAVALSPNQVVALAEQLIGKEMNVEHTAMASLEGEMHAAIHPIQKTIAALKLNYALGTQVNTLQEWQPVPHYITVAEYLTSMSNG
jgi:uncharacterized protein YbjT (DUF2867 family)